MGLRESVSLLMAHGHPEARLYPVPVVWMETKLVRRRVNRDLANSAILTQMVIGSAFSKKAGKALQERIKKLTED